jgi:hypothetical protein
LVPKYTVENELEKIQYIQYVKERMQHVQFERANCDLDTARDARKGSYQGFNFQPGKEWVESGIDRGLPSYTITDVFTLLGQFKGFWRFKLKKTSLSV